MNASVKTWVSAALIIPLFAGCASMNDQEKTRGQALGLGAVLGALAGAAIGQAAGKEAGQGALLGLVLGSAGGLVYGEHVAQQKARYVVQEDYLDACIAQASKVRQEMLNYNFALRRDIDGLDAYLQANLESLRRDQNRFGELQTVRQNVAGGLNYAEQVLQYVNQEIAVQGQVLAEERAKGGGGRVAALQGQVAELERQKAQLIQQGQRLAALNNRMSV